MQNGHVHYVPTLWAINFENLTFVENSLIIVGMIKILIGN
jgi:hypothetical protein